MAARKITGNNGKAATGRNAAFKSKPMALTPEAKRVIRKHMSPRYRLMADIIEEARNRRQESLEALGIPVEKTAKRKPVSATCPKCGHEFEMGDRSQAAVPELLGSGSERTIFGMFRKRNR